MFLKVVYAPPGCVFLLFIFLQKYIQKWITPVFSVTWFYKNHSNMLICCSRNISYYYQCWKQLCCLIVGTDTFWWVERFKRTAYIYKSFVTLTLISWMHPCWVKVISVTLYLMHYKSSFNALIMLCNAPYNVLYNLMNNGNHR